mmetsp:Transcript_21497/g.29879  ORF Transcript_21497/g.29879 Transcript_21497/m.29879 type:complete len:404 (+) Transcript_21497:71-1282(+)
MVRVCCLTKVFIFTYVLVTFFEDTSGSRTLFEDSLPKRCIVWTPRERRHEACVHTLQSVIEKLSEGNFTPEQQGRFDPKQDLAPERDWLPFDRETRTLFQTYSAYPPDKGTKCLQGHSVFFVGSSFMRQIVTEFVKYLNGTRQQAYESVDPGFKEVPSSPRGCCPGGSGVSKGICDPQHPYHPWDPHRNVTCVRCGNMQEGRDIAKAGCLPGRRLWSLHWFHLQYQFSTYVWQKELMDVWIPQLRKVTTAPRPGHPSQVKQSPYQVLVIQAGIWELMYLFRSPEHSISPSFARDFYHLSGGTNINEIFREAVQLYIEFIKANFGGTIIWVLEPKKTHGKLDFSASIISEEVQNSEHKFLVINKQPIVKEGLKAKVRPMAHGWAGPVTDTISKILISLMCNTHS